MKRLTKRQRDQRRLRQQGWLDFHAGKPIDTFHGLSRDRAVYEIGWRCARDGDEKPFGEES